MSRMPPIPFRCPPRHAGSPYPENPHPRTNARVGNEPAHQQTSRGVLDVNQGYSIRRCSGWNSADGSTAIGARRRTTGARNIIASPPAASARWAEMENWWRYVLAVDHMAPREAHGCHERILEAPARRVRQSGAPTGDLEQDIARTFSSRRKRTFALDLAPTKHAAAPHIAFGGVEAMKEEHCDGRGARWIEDSSATLDMHSARCAEHRYSRPRRSSRSRSALAPIPRSSRP